MVEVLAITQVADDGVIAGEDVVAREGPARGVLAGPWCAGWRGGGHSVAMTSLTAERAAVSSTTVLSAMKVASRDWMARLLIARG